MSKPVLVLLSRPGCHLCDDLREDLGRAFPDRFDVCEACVDDRPEWRTAYGLRIPVLLTEDGALLCEGRFDPEPLLRRYPH